MAAPSPDVSCVCARATGSPKTSAVSWTAAGLCDPPPAMRSDVSGTPVRFGGPFGALAERVGQALEDRPVEVRPGVDVPEPDDRALRLRSRDAHAGRPVRLERQAHRTGRHRPDQVVEQGLRLDAAAAGARDLVMAELALEPLDHPVAAIDLDLQRVRSPGSRPGRAGRADRLDVAVHRRVDGRGRPVRQAGDVRRRSPRSRAPRRPCRRQPR